MHSLGSFDVPWDLEDWTVWCASMCEIYCSSENFLLLQLFQSVFVGFNVIFMSLHSL